MLGDNLNSSLGTIKMCRKALADVHDAPYNPRVDFEPGTSEYERLKHSIKEHGYIDPIIYNQRTGHVVGGHRRKKVLQDLGYTHADVVVVDMSLEQEKALNVALNSLQGEWDEPKLAALLKELCEDPAFEIRDTGLDPDEVNRLFRDFDLNEDPDADFDSDAELDAEGPAVTQPGEVLVLGTHRLGCGDSTDASFVRLVMNGEQAALVHTDPPYGVGYDGSNHPGGRNGPGRRKSSRDRDDFHGQDWDNADATPALLDRFIAVALESAVVPDTAWYMWHASRLQCKVESIWRDHGLLVHQQIIWNKNRFAPSWTWYGFQHEPCFMGWQRGHKPRKIGTELLSTVWTADVPSGADRPEHPTPKPVRLFEIPLVQHLNRGGLCYEPFAGSGTQIIAAERLGRRCYAIERSPHYCDLIVRRWIHLVGAYAAPADLVARYRSNPSTVTESGVEHE